MKVKCQDLKTQKVAGVPAQSWRLCVLAFHWTTEASPNGCARFWISPGLSNQSSTVQSLPGHGTPGGLTVAVRTEWPAYGQGYHVQTRFKSSLRTIMWGVLSVASGGGRCEAADTAPASNTTPITSITNSTSTPATNMPPMSALTPSTNTSASSSDDAFSDTTTLNVGPALCARPGVHAGFAHKCNSSPPRFHAPAGSRRSGRRASPMESIIY